VRPVKRPPSLTAVAVAIVLGGAVTLTGNAVMAIGTRAPPLPGPAIVAPVGPPGGDVKMAARANADVTDDRLEAAIDIIGGDQISPRDRALIQARIDKALDGALLHAVSLVQHRESELDLTEARNICARTLRLRPQDGVAKRIMNQADDALVELTEAHAVRQQFGRGEVVAALRAAEACRLEDPQCAELARKIGAFQQQLLQLNKLSISEGNVLLTLEQEISGGDDDLHATVEGRLSDEQCRRARRSMAAKNWKAAKESIDFALEHDRLNPEAMRLALTLQTRGSTLFARAIALKTTKPDESAKLFQEIVATVPDGYGAQFRALSREKD
jgi:hypothetical protein